MAPRETENDAYANFGVRNKEHYGVLWYFLRGTQREYSSKPLKHSIVERILVLKR